MEPKKWKEQQRGAHSLYLTQGKRGGKFQREHSPFRAHPEGYKKSRRKKRRRREARGSRFRTPTGGGFEDTSEARRPAARYFFPVDMARDRGGRSTSTRQKRGSQ